MRAQSVLLTLCSAQCLSSLAWVLMRAFHWHYAQPNVCLLYRGYLSETQILATMVWVKHPPAPPLCRGEHRTLAPNEWNRIYTKILRHIIMLNLPAACAYIHMYTHCCYAYINIHCLHRWHTWYINTWLDCWHIFCHTHIPQSNIVF